MGRWLGLCLVWVLPALAEVAVTVLEPISPPERVPGAVSTIWADGAGHQVAACTARDRGSTQRSSTLTMAHSGGGWQSAVIAPPEPGAGIPQSLQLAGRWGDLHLFIAYDRAKALYRYHSTDGRAWSAGTAAVTFSASSQAALAQVSYAAGTPVVVGVNSGGGQQPGLWLYRPTVPGPGVRLSPRVPTRQAGADLVVDPHGRLYHVVHGLRYTPLVYSAPDLAAARSPAAWTVLPPATWTPTANLLPGALQLTVDPVRQWVWAVAGGETTPILKVSHLPIGAQTPGQAQTYEVAVPDGGRGGRFDLATSPVTSPLLVRGVSQSGSYYLVAFPLQAASPGPPIRLGRGASQTEAAEFGSSFRAVAATIDPTGVAHVVAAAYKKGAVTEDRERLFYGRISGWTNPGTVPQQTVFDGAAAGQTGPETTGGGGDQPPPPTGGPQPDLVAEVWLESQAREQLDLRSSTMTGLDLQIRVTNRGAPYYGDLTVQAVVGPTTITRTIKDETQHQQPLFAAGQSRLIGLGKVSYPTSGAVPPPPAKVDRSAQSASTLKLPPRLGRHRITATVDPANRVAEADETNNQDTASWVIYDGHAEGDRKVDGQKIVHYGLNDVALYDRLYIQPQGPFSRFGHRQRPTQLAVVVINPHAARWMRDVKLVATLDGRPLAEQVIPQVPDTPTLSLLQVPWSLARGSEPGRKTLRAVPLLLPLDLSQASLGDHTVSVTVDPEDELVDLVRQNNTMDLRFKVRPPGGQLAVTCVDSGSRAPIVGAEVTIEGLWFMRTGAAGRAVVEDFPPGSYPAGRMTARKADGPQPYAARTAEAFAVTSGGTTPITIALDGPVTITGKLTGPTGQPPTYGAVLAYSGQCGHVAYDRQTGVYRVEDAEPGQHGLRVTAYGYLPQTVERRFLADAQGRFALDLSLLEAPRATVSGTVSDGTGQKLAGATVLVAGTPSWAVTDQHGAFRIPGVVAGASYPLEVYQTGYAQVVEFTTGHLAASGQVTVALQVQKVTYATKGTGAHVLTWAICESYPGFEIGSAASQGYEVKAYYGEFKASLALSYHAVQGDPRVWVDRLSLGVAPGLFWKSSCSFEWDPLDLVSGAVDTITDDLRDLLLGPKTGKYVGELAKLIEPLNTVYDAVKGDVDPNQLHGDDELIGTWTSHTGDKVEEATLIDLPSTAVTVGLGYGGGATVVRCDRLVVSDGTTSRTFPGQWYSPENGKATAGVYAIGEKLDLANLEVTFHLRVLNQDLGVGPLYANSKNRLVWRPGQSRWLRFEPFPYEDVD